MNADIEAVGLCCAECYGGYYLVYSARAIQFDLVATLATFGWCVEVTSPTVRMSDVQRLAMTSKHVHAYLVPLHDVRTILGVAHYLLVRTMVPRSKIVVVQSQLPQAPNTVGLLHAIAAKLRL